MQGIVSSVVRPRPFVLTPVERSGLRRELDGLFNNDPRDGDVQGELFCLGLTDDEVRLVMDPVQRLWDALHGLKCERFDSAWLDAAAQQHKLVNDALGVLFIDFRL